MVQAELNARQYQSITSKEQTDTNISVGDLTVKKNIPYRAINAVLPILTLVTTMVYFIFSSGEGNNLKEILGSADTFTALMHCTLLSALVGAGLSIGQRMLRRKETFEAW